MSPGPLDRPERGHPSHEDTNPPPPIPGIPSAKRARTESQEIRDVAKELHKGTLNPNMGTGAIIAAIAAGFTAIIGASIPLVKALNERPSASQATAIQESLDAINAKLAASEKRQVEAEKINQLQTKRINYLAALTGKINHGKTNPTFPDLDSLKWETLPNGQAEPLNITSAEWPRQKGETLNDQE